MPPWELNCSPYDAEFQLFAHEFDSLVERLHESQSLEERRKLLRRMKVLIVEINMLILSNLKIDSQGNPNLPSSDQPTAES